MAKIKKCASCKTYTLEDVCPACGAETRDPEPPKFSYPDTYGEYRRKAKIREREEEDTDDES